MGGSSTVPGSDEGQPGVYGTEGTPAAANIPGGRGAAAVWTDHKGNTWLFGGYGFDANGDVSYLNDLWELNPTTNEWTWMSGSNTIGASGGQPGVYGTLGAPALTNVPGGRAVPLSWVDASGNLWLFGGYGYDVNGALSTLNDVWEFNPTSLEWTWMGGSNTIGASGTYGTLNTPAATNIPGSRYFSTKWTDGSGHFWLFGGYGYAGNGNFGSLNDLWEFSPSSNEWTWVGGADSISTDGGGPSGVYGTLGTAASTNIPGGRAYSGSWLDSSDNLWLFGGGGFDSAGNYGYLNDFWELNTSSNEWTWISGSSTVTANSGPPGVYGTLGVAASGNTPGGRETAIGWTGSGNNLWLFGGSGYDANDTFGSLGDLWQFNPSTDKWTWEGGSSTPGDAGQPGVYGTLGKAGAANLPGSRYYVANWTDSSGDFWLFGGLGQDASNMGGYLNDLWKFQPAAVLTSPAPGSTLTGSSPTFTWTAGVGATQYYLWLGSTGVGSKNLYDSGEITVTSKAVAGLPTNGETIYVRLWTIFSGASASVDYTYKAATQTSAVLTTPTPASTLTGSSVTFTWTAGTGETGYYLWLGSTGVGSKNLYDSGETTATSVPVAGLPTNGETIYARLWTVYSGGSTSADYTYTAASQAPAALTTPAPGSTLTGSSATFTWTTGSGAAGYYLWLGSTGVGSKNLYDSGDLTVTSKAVGGLPTNGETIYARLWTVYSGGSTSADYTYTAATQTSAALTTPTPGSTLTGPSVTFTWTAGTGGTGYYLWLGSTGVGSKNLYDSGEVTVTSKAVAGLPANGETIYARLWTITSGGSLSADYTYTAATQAVLKSPAVGSTLGTSNVMFTWTAGTGVTNYQLWLGTSGPGSSSLYNSGVTSATSATVSRLPANGVTVYARLFSMFGGATQYSDYSFTEQSTNNLQVLSNWEMTHDQGTPGTSSGVTNVVSTPSISGIARMFGTSFTDSGGERYYVSFGNDTVSTNFVYKAMIWIASGSLISNLEMDTNQVVANGDTVIYGVQCDGVFGTWDYTENSGTPEVPVDTWVHSNAPCNPSTWGTNQWHSVQMSYSRDANGNVTYNSVSLDGVEITINATVPSAFALGWNPTLLTNFQIDGLGASGSSTVYLDDLTIQGS